MFVLSDENRILLLPGDFFSIYNLSCADKKKTSYNNNEKNKYGKVKSARIHCVIRYLKSHNSGKKTKQENITQLSSRYYSDCMLFPCAICEKNIVKRKDNYLFKREN